MAETDERVREGVEHLQRAALELIAAARAFLDIAEEAVKDPTELLARANAVAAATRRRDAGADHGHEQSDDDFEHIRVV